MENLDQETIDELKTQRVAELLGQVLIDTALAVLCRLEEKTKMAPPVICYKDDCPMRDDIPF